MMTLKHVDLSGRENVVSLASASYDPKTLTLIGHDVQDGTGMRVNQTWRSGHAFLMNEHGKTVAVYHLNQKQESK